LNQWEELNHYLLDGSLEIDNNRAEPQLSPSLLEERTFYSSNTPKGARGSATIYSIIETAKENNLKPFEYLQYLFRAIAQRGYR
jgi:hypothetical protein